VNNVILISLLMISLVACAPQNSAPTITSSPIPRTSTVIPVTLTPTSTTTPEIVPTLTSTPRLPYQILNSPNGEFIAELENADSHPAFEPQVIKIHDNSGSLLWEIPYQHETAMVDPHPGLRLYGWSKDNAFLYFYYKHSPDGGDRAFWWEGFDLQRINVQTGHIEQVIPGDPNNFVAFTFSSDETQLAYTRAQDNPSILYIRNLSTGAQKAASVIFPEKSYIRVGDIHWSPSGEEIAFQTETEDYMAQTIILTLATMEQQVVREYMVDTSYFQGWTDDGNLEFLDFDKGVRIVHVNPKNKETIVIGTPTPKTTRVPSP
jgi:hypothetical protein